MAALQEVIDIQQILSDEQLRIARFWVDGHGSVTPPGHWNEIAIEHTRQADLDHATAMQLFVDLNMALADTFIAVWEAKYYYWTARPVTEARRVLGAELRPAILTPPFPSYPSGHAGFSGAAGEILASYFPDHETTLRSMADEAANSRLLGGIHYRFDNDDGLALGREVARLVLGGRTRLGLIFEMSPCLEATMFYKELRPTIGNQAPRYCPKLASLGTTYRDSLCNAVRNPRSQDHGDPH